MLSPIYITEEDARQLRDVVQWAQNEAGMEDANLARFEKELERAQIVAADELPRDAVTMNSKVVLYDLDAEESEPYTLVYPWAADANENRISVLAPIGTAVIGCRVGDVVEWPVPAGLRRLRIDEVVYQPREGEVAA